jgi:SAM-dependent methyltransferase
LAAIDTGKGGLPLIVPIHTPDGGTVTAFDSSPDWRDIKRGTIDVTAPVGPASLLEEEHHRIYGRPWVLGRCYFDELIARGIKPTDRVLDLGCGAGRVGVWLIPFLEAGRYFGQDWHLSSLVAFSAYECLMHDLGPKRPTLMLDERFRLDRFGVQFDVVLDFHTSVHLPMEQRIELFSRIAGVCAPNARLFMARKPKVDLSVLFDAGLKLTSRADVDYPVLRTWPPEYAIRDRWYEFVYDGANRRRS